LTRSGRIDCVYELIGLVAGCVAVAAAGFAAAFVPRRRAGGYTRRAAWSGARATIDVASISRDAAPTRVVEAEELLARAEAIAAARGGRARAAAGYAKRADALWRAAADG